ncbi:MAG: hypothetical protein ACYDAR_15965 [Thermomicrobiales bacterium]
MIVMLALILGGAVALPRLADGVPSNQGAPIVTPTVRLLASDPTATIAPTIAPPVAPVFAARVVGQRVTEPTPTPIPPTPTPTPVIPNGPLLTSRLVTFYGHPDNNRLGILGQFSSPAAMIVKLKAQAAAYHAADPSRPVIPTIELIASVASDTPGRDGLYLNRTPLPLIEEYAQIAEQNGCLLLLDIQLGYDTVANEVSRLAPILKRPSVHLAIDPEFHVKRGEIPGEAYGSVSADEVMTAAKMLAAIVTANGITDKVLVIHQFRDDMLPDKATIKPVGHVQIVTDMDGFGAPAAKTKNYTTFVHDELIQYGGIKLFYKQDVPLMTPADVVALDPSPLVVIYQ